MLELLATVDPMAALMGGLWLFAAGMFPVGFMLGSSCIPCCGEIVCGGIKLSELPETITVELGEWTDSPPVRGPDLAHLEFVSTFGGGAAGKVTAPSETPGPLSAVELTSGGGGYAAFGRTCPTVSASPPGGTGAVLSVSLSTDYDELGLPFCKIGSISITNGGSGYTNNQQFSYPYFSLSPSSATVLGWPFATIKTKRNKPELSAVCFSETGSGATLSVRPDRIVETEDWYGGFAYTATEIEIDEPGINYQVGDFIQFGFKGTPTPGRVALDMGYAVVSSVNLNGSITGTDVYSGGLFYIETGEIGSVIVDDPGVFYVEDPSLPPIVSSVTVNVLQQGTVTASGATLQANIDTNTASQTFGSILSVSILSGGTGYLAWDLDRTYECCGWYWSGKSAVLSRGKDGVYLCRFGGQTENMTCGNAQWVLNYDYSTQATLGVSAASAYPQGCGRGLIALASDQPTGKLEFPFTMTGDGITAVVSAGGKPPTSIDTTAPAGAIGALGSGNRYPCCRGGTSPSEITMTIEPLDTPDGEEPPEPTDIVLMLQGSSSAPPGVYCANRWCSQPGCMGASWDVVIRPCGNAYAGTATCPPMCETFIYYRSYNFYGFDYPTFVFSEPDKKCKVGTMCAPEPGVYEISRVDPRETETVKTPGTSNVKYVQGQELGPTAKLKVTIQ